MESKEKRYHLLIEDLQDPLACYQIIRDDAGDPTDYVYLDINSSFEEMTGCTRDEVIGKRVSEIFLLKERFDLNFHSIYEEAALTGERTCFEQYLEAQKRWYNITVTIDNQGYLVALFRDITDTRAKEERTKELSCLYTISRLLGNEKNNLDKVLRESIEHIPAAFQEPENTFICITFKSRIYKTRDFKRTSTRISYPIVAYNEPVGSIEVCYLHDPLQDESLFLEEERIMLNTIAELLSSAVEQRESEEALQDSRDFLETTLHSLGDALISTDNRGIIANMNPVAERLTNWSLDEAKGRPVTDIFKILHEKTQRTAESPLVSIHDTGKSVTHHHILMAKDGTKYQITYTASPIKKKGQKISGMVLIFRDVTEERRIQKSLKESKERLSILISSIQDIVFTLDTKQRHTDVYGPWVREQGLTPQSFLGRTVKDLLGDEEARVHVEANERALQGEYVVYEWSRDVGEGKVYYETSLSPIRDEEGMIKGLIGIGRNITKRKKAQLSLQESEAFIKLVMDNLPIGIAVHSLDPTIAFEYMNDNFAKYYHTTKESLSDRDSFWEVVYEDEDFRKEIRSRILADIATGDPERMYWEDIPIGREEENETYYVTAKTTPIPDSSLLISTVLDVTEHKQTKDKMKKNIEHLALLLHASESLSRLLNLPEILQILTKTAVELLDMDSAAIYLLEEEDELHLSATIPPLPDDLSEELCKTPLKEHPHIWKALKTSSTVILPDTRTEDLTEAEQNVCEMRNLRTNVYLPLVGSREVLGVLIVGSTGEPCNVLESQLTHSRTLGTLAAIAIENTRLYSSLQNELTERRQAEEALQKVQDELEERVLQRTAELEEARKEAIAASHAKSEFLLKISHELRTPLHAILSYSDLGLEVSNEEGHEEMVGYFQKIYHSGNRLLFLIDDLLDLSRIEVGSIEYNFEVRDLYELVTLSKEEMVTLLEGKDIQLKITRPSSATLVKVDANRILQVLRNLIHNAIKFSPRKSSIKITFTQSLSTTPTLETHITDEGPGIAPEDLDSIFEKFRQSYRDGSKMEGTGLGLAICKEIIQAHDGWIYAENEPDNGAKITFVLPVVSQ